MMQRSILASISTLVLISASVLLATMLFSGNAAAACDTTNLSISTGADCARGTEQPSDLFGGENSIFSRVTNILLFLVGAISVIMLIIGGIRYVISGGDQAQVTGAKNTILYAIVGIVVAFLAYAAVNFITQALVGANAA